MRWKNWYVCISNLSIDPVNILMPIGAETKPTRATPARLERKRQLKAGNVNKCVWTPSKSRIVTVNGLEKRFVLAGILHDEVLGNGSTTATSTVFY